MRPYKNATTQKPYPAATQHWLWRTPVTKDEILSYVSLHPGCTASEVKKAISRPAINSESFSALVNKGLIRREGGDKRGMASPFNPWRYYPLN